MQWWTDFWAWYAAKFQEDPSGWISLYFLVGGLIFASVFWKRIVGWVKRLRPRYEAHMRRKYGGEPPLEEVPVKNTLSIRFASRDETIAAEFINLSGESRGGTITY